MTEKEAEKIARTESLFREVNERIAESAKRFNSTETEFICECADPSCAHRVETTLMEYERVREDGDTFLLEPGHEDDRVEAVVELIEGYAVVQKRQPEARRLAVQLDPRAA